MIFAQMLEIVALIDLALVLYARKLSFAPQGGFDPKTPLFGSPDVFRLRKEPINSLSSVRTYVRTYVRSGPTALTVQYFFLIFCVKLCLHMT